MMTGILEISAAKNPKKGATAFSMSFAHASNFL